MVTASSWQEWPGRSPFQVSACLVAKGAPDVLDVLAQHSSIQRNVHRLKGWGDRPWQRVVRCSPPASRPWCSWPTNAWMPFTVETVLIGAQAHVLRKTGERNDLRIVTSESMTGMWKAGCGHCLQCWPKLIGRRPRSPCIWTLFAAGWGPESGLYCYAKH
jgi:hypothetical protein